MQGSIDAMKNKFLFVSRSLFTCIGFVLLAHAAHTQVTLPAASPYSQNFNTTPGASGTTYPTGWTSYDGTTADASMITGGATSTTGANYNYSSRIGLLGSGSAFDPGSIVLHIANTTGKSSLKISYDIIKIREQGRDCSFDLEISTTSATTGFTSVPGGNYASGSLAQNTISAYEDIDISTLDNRSGSIWIRWYYASTGSGSRDGMALDNVSISWSSGCASPNAIAFETQPSNISQGSNMTAVKVKAICSATGATATGYTGAVTLTLNTPGCGYTSQTVNAIAGIATFSSINIARSPQSNLKFTASATGYTSITSNAFNVTSPAGTPTTTIITQNNFDAQTAWSYTPVDNNDLTIKTFSGNNVLAKSSPDNTSSTNTATFSNITGLSSYTQLIFDFQIASLGSGNGAGNDSGEDATIEISTNNGSSWTKILTLEGGSNRLFPLSGTPVTALSLSNTISTGNNSAFRLTLTGPVSQFRFRFTAKNDRPTENWVIDNIKLTGIAPTSLTAPFPLPDAEAEAANTICNDGNTIPLNVEVSSFQPGLTYTWSPATGLSSTSVANPVATTSSASTTYTVVVTDGHNCKATASVTVTAPGFGGTPGLWTGNVSSDWFDCRNWSDYKVPDEFTDVKITGTSNISCEINEVDAVCRNLTLSSSGVNHPDLYILQTGTLKVIQHVVISNSGSGVTACTLHDFASLECQNLTIEGNGTGKGRLQHENATASVTVNANLIIETGGELDMDDENDLTQDATLTLKGDFINLASETDFKQGNSSIILAGAGAQAITTADANEVFYNLIIDKSNGDLTLSGNVTVTRQLTMNAGNILTPAGHLELGESIDQKGLLDHHAGFIIGKMRRWFSGTNAGNTSGLFPMGFEQDGLKNRQVSVEYTNAPSKGGYLTVEFMAAAMGMAGIPILSTNTGGTTFDVTSVENLGYWKIDNQADKLTDGNYTIACTGEGFGTINELSKLTLLKRVNGGDWMCPGEHLAPVGTTDIPVLSRSNVSGWSNFGFGGGINNPLPVELVTFKASCTPNAVDIQWVTASEKNADYFIVEKSVNGKDWIETGKVQAAGNSAHAISYSLRDMDPLREITYYRLSQFDHDGKNNIYNPVSTDCQSAAKNVFRVYPNPAREQFKILINDETLAGETTISITSADGRLISSQKVYISPGDNLLSYGNLQLTKGIYYIVADSHLRIPLIIE